MPRNRLRPVPSTSLTS